VLDGHTFVAISAGALHTCALDDGGLAWCWGNQDFGRLGNNNTFAGNVTSPVAVFGSLVFSSISAGLEHTCAIQASNLAAYCWGRQANGRLGNNSVVDVGVGTPQSVQGGLAFLSVTAGLHTCGVVAPDTDRRGFCWGSNANGQLGVATLDFADKSVPTVVANSLRFANLDAGYLHTCGATVGGSGFCWGLASEGRLGNGEVAGNRETPRQILGAFSFTKVHAAKAGDSFQSAHSCAMTTKGAYCWGDNLFGYLGDGSTLLTSTPIRVRGQR
jgi:alpha-tubulin suppressor-like RCC1 family protein